MSYTQYAKEGGIWVLKQAWDAYGKHHVSHTILDGRPTTVIVHGRFHSPTEPLVYDGTAIDDQTGTTAKSRHHKGKSGAAEHALRELGAKLKEKGILE